MISQDRHRDLLRALVSELKRLKEPKVVIFDADDNLFDTETLAKMPRMNDVKAMIKSELAISPQNR